jgi:very-short-patch-repair endonuclease
MTEQAKKPSFTDVMNTVRARMSPTEKSVWARLKSGSVPGVSFKRKVKIGPYTADFADRSKKVVVEVREPEDASKDPESDKARLEYFKKQGYRVLKVTKEIINDPAFADALATIVAEAVEEATRKIQEADFDTGG